MPAIDDPSPCPKCGGPRVRYVNAAGKRTAPNCRPCNSKKTLEAYYANPEPARARARERYQQDPEAGRARRKEAYYKDPEKARAAGRADYHANAEARRAKSREWHQKNPERAKELTARWKAANRDRIKAYNAAYYVENRESEIARCLAYIKANPEVNAAIRHRREARKRDAVCEHGPRCVTSEFVKQIRESDCLYCGESDTPGHADHFIPLSRGGLHCVENIVPACVHCNTSKHAMDPYDWLAGLKRT